MPAMPRMLSRREEGRADLPHSPPEPWRGVGVPCRGSSLEGPSGVGLRPPERVEVPSHVCVSAAALGSVPGPFCHSAQRKPSGKAPVTARRPGGREAGALLLSQPVWTPAPPASALVRSCDPAELGGLGVSGPGQEPPCPGACVSRERVCGTGVGVCGRVF